MWWKLHDPNFNRFCMNHSCDGQTDRRTDGIAIAYARLQHSCRAQKSWLSTADRQVLGLLMSESKKFKWVESTEWCKFDSTSCPKMSPNGVFITTLNFDVKIFTALLWTLIGPTSLFQFSFINLKFAGFDAVLLSGQTIIVHRVRKKTAPLNKML